MARESIKDAEIRWKKLELLQQHYAKFSTFLPDVIENFLGFKCTDIQEDIGNFLADGPTYSMIQAQRGQAKTTITACYAVWRLIHNPSLRILIVSAGGDLAQEISNWVIQIIRGMPELACMRPDETNGDRASVKAFDVHYTLKGPEKSPSLACLGVTSNSQGRRADLLIADDIESAKNAATETQREKLRNLTKDFTSICSKGKIVYLGTPQSIDSIYNGLPSRGYQIRIWPGRYPTEEEEKNYGGALAPLLTARMRDNPNLRKGGGLTGDMGQATDPVLLSEYDLTKKELDQGSSYFQLQHMLNTRLMDADRYPLKSNRLVFMRIPQKRIPITVNWVATQEHRVYPPMDFPVQEDYYEVTSHSDEWADYQGTCMYLDPSGGGQNGDEMAYAVTKFQSGSVYLVDVGGFPGGLSIENQERVADKCLEWKVDVLKIEDNFGAGTFREVITPTILKKHKCGIEGVWESGQKELRIIETLEPMIGGQRLIVDTDLIYKDWEQCQKYAIEKRPTYSFFFQLARLTRDRGCLAHDDRLDAVAGSCRHWTEMLAVDKAKEIAKLKQADYRAIMNNPLGNGRAVLGFRPQYNTIMDRFKRK